MGRNDAAWLVGGGAVVGWGLYALTRPTSAATSSSTRSRRTPTTEPPEPTTKQPGSYWNPSTRATIGEFDPAIARFTKGWVWPVETENREPWRNPVVSDGYHFRKHRERWHNGVDIMYRRDHALVAAERIKNQQSKWYDMWHGTKAIAVGPGQVVEAGRIRTGGRVRIDHGAHVVTGYYHLDRIDVGVGDTVKAGNILGIVGKNPSEPRGLYHMHFEIWHGWLHKVLDPEPYLRRWGTVGRRAPLRIVK
jgi:murein DD-endopeptidase MepM/ murein hydrolase activator NlpD